MDERLILLIGGTGQVGREIRELSWPDGWTVRAPTRDELDLGDRAALTAAVESQPWAAIVNAAAYTAVDAAEANESLAWSANAHAPEILAEASGRRNIPLVHISTDYVFDGARAGAYVESDPTNPLGVYGKSKLAGEEAVRAGNPHHLIVRTSWVFGRYGGNFVKTMLRLAHDRPSIRVVDDQTGSPTCARDLAGALAAMVQQVDARREPWGTYHFANAGVTSWCGFARTIFALSAARGGPSADVVAITTKDYPTPAPRPANSRLSTDKFARDFGLSPRPFETALDEVLSALSVTGFR